MAIFTDCTCGTFVRDPYCKAAPSTTSDGRIVLHRTVDAAGRVAASRNPGAKPGTFLLPTEPERAGITVTVEDGRIVDFDSTDVPWPQHAARACRFCGALVSHEAWVQQATLGHLHYPVR